MNVWVANCLYYTIVFIYSAGLKFLGSPSFLQICINHGLPYTSTSWPKTSNVAVFLQCNWVGTISLPISELGIQYLLLSAWDLSAWLFLQRFGRATGYSTIWNHGWIVKSSQSNPYRIVLPSNSLVSKLEPLSCLDKSGSFGAIVFLGALFCSNSIQNWPQRYKIQSLRAIRYKFTRLLQCQLWFTCSTKCFDWDGKWPHSALYSL